MWDVDTNDWRKPGSSVVAARAVNGAKPGSIILVHDIHASTVAAVDAIVKGLKNRGYELVTVSELIRRGRAAAGHAPSMPASPAVPDSSPPFRARDRHSRGARPPFPLKRWQACNLRRFPFSILLSTRFPQGNRVFHARGGARFPEVRRGWLPLNGYTHRRLDLLANFSTIPCRITHTQSGLKCL